MKLIIAGSRSIPEHDYMLLEAALEASPFSFQEIEEVVSGMALGADMLGYNWALQQGLEEPKKMPADWDDITVPGAVVKYHKSGPKKGRPYNVLAGHMRNQKMVDYADAALFLWDGQSTGTKDCIRRAKTNGIPHYIHYVKP